MFALYSKNALVAWRNRRATILRVLAPLFFLLLALAIEQALIANNQAQGDFKNTPNPEPEKIKNIPSCHEDLYIDNSPCVELAFSPNTSAIAQMIIGNVTSRNGDTEISAIGFETPEQVNEFLLANPDYVIGAVNFEFFGSQIGFTLQTNRTVKYFKGYFQDGNTFAQLPIQSAVQREITRYYLNQNPSTRNTAEMLDWDVSIVPFAHPTISTSSIVGQVLGPFIFAACLFSFVVQLSSMVGEKELGLRQALTGMGMKDSAYWGSWGLWELTLAFVQAHLMVIFGLILQFDLFKNNNYGLLWFLFFLFLMAMSSFAMLLTVFIRRAQVAVYLGFMIFIIGWIMQIVVLFGVPYSPDYYHKFGSAITIIFSFFPWDLLAKGFDDLGSATSDSDAPGIDWSERYSYCSNVPNADQIPYNPREVYKDYDCVMPLGDIYVIFTIQWLGYFVLAVYCDNVWPNEQGIRRPLWYFLLPSYWFPRPQSAVSALTRVQQQKEVGPPPDGPLDDDVVSEAERLKELMTHRTGRAGELARQDGNHSPNAVEVYGLKKLFQSYGGCCGCFGCGGCCSSCKNSAVHYHAFWAIRDSWFGIEENQLFCLLGPNGAGKTTTINCLTGVIKPTAGDALVYGESICSPGGMDRVRGMMGVCPQFDVLWGELSGREHLQIYGSVKGVKWSRVRAEADELLEKVKLTHAALQRSSAYSGGMKRRLSVAIALLGDPKIVYLDEPTTGMDPISRRYVWDIIQAAKVGRAIVLTTHSMEEADILGDRIAIMARGQLRCLGTSLRLKQKFGSGYQIAVSVSPGTGAPPSLEDLARRSAAVKKFFYEGLGLEPVDESKAYISFVVGRELEPQLAAFMARLERDSEALGVSDIQMSLTSLEEVFLNIAKRAEISAATSMNRTMEVTVGDVVMQVPVGEEWVMHPTTRQTYQIKWGQDADGSLAVLEAVAASPPGGVAPRSNTGAPTALPVLGQPLPVSSGSLEMNAR